MKYHPILFSAPMVQARRAGLKTMTRRVVKPQPEWTEPSTAWQSGDGHSGPGWYAHNDEYPEEGALFYRCPYGQPGDRLWIKEEHYLFGTWRIDGRRKDGKFKLRFETDRSMGVLFDQEPNGLITGRHTGAPGWYKRIGMFMPRWASRDTDEIVSVRVERLKDISEADAMAEGVRHSLNLAAGRTAAENYSHLWDCINGDGAWDANPWVWVLEFRRVTYG